MVPQCAEEMHDDQRRKQISQDFVRVLEQTMPGSIVIDHRNSNSEKIMVERLPARAGQCPADNGPGEHQEIEAEMAELRGVPLPWLEVGRQIRNRVQPT